MLVQYDPLLVLLSVAVAIMGSFTGLALTSGALWSHGSHLKIRVLKGAIAIGGSIWAMHFIAMLAVKLPIAVNYDVLYTLISALTAMLVTGLGLYMVSYRPLKTLSLPAGGLFMGSGIVGMHYIGMGAIRAGCIVDYSPSGVIASVAIAVTASTFALWFAFRHKTFGETLLGGISLGLAIASMHYAAMFSTSFVPIKDVAEVAAPVLTQDYLAIVVAVVSFVLCGLFLLMALPDEKRLRERTIEIEADAGHDMADATNGAAYVLANDPASQRRIPVHKNGATLYLSSGDIVTVTAQGHYTLVSNERDEYFCDLSISKLAKLLDGGPFAQPHRSHLVNLRFVQGFSKKGDRGYLILDGGFDKTVPVSRAKIKGILHRLEFEPDYSSVVSGA